MPLKNKVTDIEDLDIDECPVTEIYAFGQNLQHFGVGHEDGGHSGRYPWGSGDKSFQRPRDFYSFVRHLENKIDPKTGKGLTRVEIAQSLGMSTTELKKYYTLARNLTRNEIVLAARALANQETDSQGNRMTHTRIGEILGEKYNEDKSPIGESTIRLYLDTQKDAKQNAVNHTANMLMKTVDEKGMIDVGTMVDKEIGISKEKMNAALAICQHNGYVLLYGSVPQATNPNQKTNYRVLAPKGTPNSEAYIWDKIKQIKDYTTDDNGKSFRPAFVYPKSINMDRVMIRYAEEGGIQKDGTIEIREGVKDLSLNGSRYAQVRILVDNGGGTNDVYLKGMAVYNDGSNMPDGVDIIFNTNKPLGTPKTKVLKSVKDNLEKDPNNPFGAAIKEFGGQSYYDDPNGEYTDPITGHKQSLSAINKRADAGDWMDWSNDIPSQMLSKQPKATIAKQLKKTLQKRRDEFDEIMKIDNPTVKAKLLLDFADNMDVAAADLKACPFDGMHYHVILPVPSLKDNEIFAPNYPDGSQLALVRFPHGGIFEIPILTVNNHNIEAIKTMGADAIDAVGINAHNASILSGADFDGDTVLTIPTNNGKTKIQNMAPLKGLKDFDTGLYGPDADDGIRVDANGEKHYYRDGMEYQHMTEQYKQTQMGIVSNLITDMTLKGATPDELARADRHSMVVIDAVKHDLNFKQSEIDNGIKELKNKYQKKQDSEGPGGASTLISRATNEKYYPKRAEGAFILNQEGNPDNGNVLEYYNPNKKIYIDPKTGKKYSEKNRKIVNIDPETGKKLYHDTKEGIVKVVYKDDDGNKITAPAYIMDENRKAKRSRYIIREDDKDSLNQLYFMDSDGVLTKFDAKKHKLLNVESTQKIEQMLMTDDARTLSSGTVQEEYYAEYANGIKGLADLARLNYLYFDANPIPYDSSATKKYADEYASLEAKVSKAELNAPRERAANLTAAAKIKAQIDASDDNMTSEEIKKLRQNEIVKARAKYGAKNARFTITPEEWAAVQAGAFSKSRLQKILRYADQDCVRKLATPREELKLSAADINRIKALSANGETNSAIAARLHIGLSTVLKYLGKEE